MMARATSESRQVSVDTGSLITLLYSLVYLAIFLYLLNWFYKAVKRVEESLQRIEKRLESLENGTTQAVTPGPTSSAPPKRMERVSNLWAVPAVLFIIAVVGGGGYLTGYGFLGVELTILLFGAAGAMVVVAAAWEVVRRR